MKIKKGDNILIISGKDRGKKAKVLEVFPKEGKIVAEGVSIRKKHVKPKKTGEKGQIVHLPAAFDVSNAKIICPKCGKAARIGYKIITSRMLDISSVVPPAIEKKKNRFCKKCGGEI